MTDLTNYQPGPITTVPESTVSYLDPTGGRLVAWAQAASAANQLAKALSTTTFVPKDMQNVGNATAAILAGDELGLSPLAALRSIYVVHGTPALYARAMVALALGHGHEIWTEETTDAKVVVCGRRRGLDKVERSEWTIQRATKAGYTSNKKYGTNPQEMLYSKAAAEIARKIAPDVLAGMPYSVEDIELGETPTTTVTRESAQKRTVQRRKAEVPEPVEPDLAPTAPDPEPTATPITTAQNAKMHALFGDLGITDHDAQIAGITRVIGRDIDSKTELTVEEAAFVIDSLEIRLRQSEPTLPIEPDDAA